MAEPRTHAVGKLVLFYGDGTNEHTFSVGLLEGEDPFNGATMLAYADRLAGYVRAVLPSSFTITHWRSLDTNLVEALSLPLSAPADGTHGTDSGFPAFKSLTACVTGMTETPVATNRIQQTRAFLFVLNAITLVPGEKEFSAAGMDAPWRDLVEELNNSANYWGDVQGRKAACRDSIKVQLNAFVQHQLGS